MLWAERVLSPNWASFFNTESRPWNNKAFPKFIVLLSDGNAANLFWGDIYGSVSDADVNVNLQKVCNDLKQKGVRIMSISYAGGVIPAMESCASPNSHFVASESDIGQVFKNIAKTVKAANLRVAN